MSEVGPPDVTPSASGGDGLEQQNSIKMTAVHLLPHHQVTPPATPPPDTMSSAGAVEHDLGEQGEEDGAGDGVENNVTGGGDATAPPSTASEMPGEAPSNGRAIEAHLLALETAARAQEQGGQGPDQPADGIPAQGAGGEQGESQNQVGTSNQSEEHNMIVEVQPDPDTTIDDAPGSSRGTPSNIHAQPTQSSTLAPRQSYSDVWERLRPLVSTTPQPSSPASSSPIMASSGVIPTPVTSTNFNGNGNARLRQVSDSPEPAPRNIAAPAIIDASMESSALAAEAELPSLEPPLEPPQPPAGTSQALIPLSPSAGSQRIPAPVRPAIRILHKLLNDSHRSALTEEGAWEPLLLANYTGVMSVWQKDLDTLRGASSWPATPSDLMVKEQEYRNFVSYCQVRYPGQLAIAQRLNTAGLSRRTTDPSPLTSAPLTAPPVTSTFGFANSVSGSSGTNPSPALFSPIQRPTSQPTGPPLSSNRTASPATRQGIYLHPQQPPMPTAPMPGMPISARVDSSPHGAAQWNSASYGTGLSQGRLVQPGPPEQTALNWSGPSQHLSTQQMMKMMGPPAPPIALQPVPMPISQPQTGPSPAVPVANWNPAGQASNLDGLPPATMMQTPAEAAWASNIKQVSANLQTAWNTILQGQASYANTMKETMVALEHRLATETTRGEHYHQKCKSLHHEVQNARQQAASAKSQLALAQKEGNDFKQRWSQMAAAGLATQAEHESMKAQFERLAAANREANDDKERLQEENEKFRAEREKSRADDRGSDVQRLALIIEHWDQQLEQVTAQLKDEHATEVKTLKEQQAAHLRTNNLKMAVLEKEKADEIARLRIAQETAIKGAAAKDDARVRSLEKANAQLKDELKVAQASSVDKAAMDAHAAREVEWIKQKEALEAKVTKLSIDRNGLENRLSSLQSGYARILAELEGSKRAVAAKDAEMTALEESSAATIEETEANAKKQYEKVAERLEKVQAALTATSTSEASLRQTEAELLERVASLEGAQGRLEDKEKEVLELQSQLEVSDRATLDSKDRERGLSKEKKALEDNTQSLEKEVKRLALLVDEGAKETTSAGSVAPALSTSSLSKSRKNGVKGSEARAASPKLSSTPRPAARPSVTPSSVHTASAGSSKKRERSPVKPTTKDNEPLFMSGSQSESPVLKKAKLDQGPEASSIISASTSPVESVSMEWIKAHLSIGVMEVLDDTGAPIKVVCKICHVDTKKPIKQALARQGFSKEEQEARATTQVGLPAEQAGLPGLKSRARDEAAIIQHLDQTHQSTLVRLKAQRDSLGKGPPSTPLSKGQPR